MRHAFHVAQHALHHLLKITFALAQIRVIHLVELACDHIQLRGQRPLGVVQTIFHPLRHAVSQHGVVQQHEVNLKNRSQLWGRLFGQVVVQLLQLSHHRLARF